MKLLLSIIFLFLFTGNSISQTTADNRAVFQICLDIEEFQTFFHPEVKGRVPLIIYNTGVCPEINGITKFNSEVLFWDKKEIFFYAKKEYLIFEEFRISDSVASVHFTYPIEGAYAKISLEKTAGKWLTNKVEVGEY